MEERPYEPLKEAGPRNKGKPQWEHDDYQRSTEEDQHLESKTKTKTRPRSSDSSSSKRTSSGKKKEYNMKKGNLQKKERASSSKRTRRTEEESTSSPDMVAVILGEVDDKKRRKTRSQQPGEEKTAEKRIQDVQPQRESTPSAVTEKGSCKRARVPPPEGAKVDPGLLQKEGARQLEQEHRTAREKALQQMIQRMRVAEAQAKEKEAREKENETSVREREADRQQAQHTPTDAGTNWAWHRNTPPAEPVEKPKESNSRNEEDPWELRLEQVKYFTLIIANECKREPHIVEVRILARELQSLTEHMEEELVMSSIRTFVEEFSVDHESA